MNNYKLKDLLSIKNGRDHKELSDGDIPIFGSGGIMRYGDKAIYNDESILLPRKGTLSNIQYVNKPFWTVDTIYYSVINKNLANPFYLFNFLKCLDLTSLNSGTGVPSMTFNSYYDLKVKLPDLPTQKSIAKVLSNLDSKIELNNKINRELEAMAKTLYDYWFVQFDFPCLPSDYRPSGQVNPNNELAQKIKAFSTYTKVGGLPSPDGKQWFVYVILCEDGSFYKGITNDLYRRFYEHYIGDGARWTKAKKPKKIIHWEAFATQSEARQREEELKSGFGRTWLQREYDKLVKYGAVAKDGLPAHQTRLMPAGKMVYNAELKREIPGGWEVKKLTQIANITMGQSPSGSSYNDDGIGEIFFQGCTDFGWRYPTIRQYTTEPSRMAKSGDILLSVRAPVGTLNIADNDCCIGRGLAALNSKSGFDSYLYYVMEYFKQIFDHRNNSGTTFGSITKDDLHSLKLVYPKDDLLKKYNQIVSKYNQMILNNHKQNQHLTALRDWLLPMLMNGQVTVRQAHGKLEAEERISSATELSRIIAAEPSVKYGK